MWRGELGTGDVEYWIELARMRQSSEYARLLLWHSAPRLLRPLRRDSAGEVLPPPELRCAMTCAGRFSSSRRQMGSPDSSLSRTSVRLWAWGSAMDPEAAEGRAAPRAVEA